MESRVREQSLIRRTGQSWKVVTGFVGMIVGGSIMLAAILADHLVGTLAGIAAVAGAIVGSCLCVRCPLCRDAWVWRAMRTQDASSWVPWLLTLTNCPRCARA